MLASRLRSVVRPLRARPGFSAVVVLTLALGIALNTAIYTVVDAALIRTLPFRQPDRLVKVDQFFLERPEKNAEYSWPGLLELRERTDVLSGVAAYTEHTVAVRLGDRTELIPGAGVTGNFLEVISAPASTRWPSGGASSRYGASTSESWCRSSWQCSSPRSWPSPSLHVARPR
ncbi:MAG TPA: hypothetical protein VGF41_14080 [Myxococcaceae bacterium]